MEKITEFTGGENGQWKVIRMEVVQGEPLEFVSFLKITESSLLKPAEGKWSLKGVVSNVRYTEKNEKQQLTEKQEDLGRNNSTCAALIPVRKSEEWWNLSQDERRKIFEEQSHHIRKGMEFLPQIARRLYHSRDIGQPFDFITWFEYAPEYADRFEELVNYLRNTEEWKYVVRETDIRVVRRF